MLTSLSPSNSSIVTAGDDVYPHRQDMRECTRSRAARGKVPATMADVGWVCLAPIVCYALIH
jgi:hypothetical protein